MGSYIDTWIHRFKYKLNTVVLILIEYQVFTITAWCTSSIPNEDIVFLWHFFCNLKCFQTCWWRSQVISVMSAAYPVNMPAHPGSPRYTQCSPWHSEVFINQLQSITLYSKTSHQRSKLLRNQGGILFQGLILCGNCCISVFTPNLRRHSLSLPVTRTHFADVTLWLSLCWVVQTRHTYITNQLPRRNGLYNCDSETSS